MMKVVDRREHEPKQNENTPGEKAETEAIAETFTNTVA